MTGDGARVPSSGSPDAMAAAYARGRADAEREIVTWLRKRSDAFCSDDIGVDMVADEIERGEHRTSGGR